MANNSNLEAAGGQPNATQGDDEVEGGPGCWARMQTFKDKSVYVSCSAATSHPLPPARARALKHSV